MSRAHGRWWPLGVKTQGEGAARWRSRRGPAPSRWPGWRPWPWCHDARPWPLSPPEATPGEGSRAQTCSEPEQERRSAGLGQCCRVKGTDRTAGFVPDAGHREENQALAWTGGQPCFVNQSPRIHSFMDEYGGLQAPCTGRARGLQTIVLDLQADSAPVVPSRGLQAGCSVSLAVGAQRGWP